MSNSISQNFFKEIKDVLQLPSNCKTVDIKLTVDSLVCISVVLQPDGEQCDKLIDILKTYKLEKI